jgi:hypothetical protein
MTPLRESPTGRTRGGRGGASNATPALINRSDKGAPDVLFIPIRRAWINRA